MALLPTDTCAAITGGAGGLGLALALKLLQNGARGVALLDLSARPSALVMELLAQFGPRRVLYLTCDVTDSTQLEAALHAARREFGCLNLIANNAGIAAPLFERIDAQCLINLAATLHGTRIAIELLDRPAVVLNVASVAGLGPVSLTPVYAASKAAVVNFTRSLRFMEAQGVRVVCVCPGWADTNMLQKGMGEDAGFRKLIEGSRLGILSPGDVADAMFRAVFDGAFCQGGDAVAVTAASGAWVAQFGRPDRPPPARKAML